jgi:hypothetical protein
MLIRGLRAVRGLLNAGKSDKRASTGFLSGSHSGSCPPGQKRVWIDCIPMITPWGLSNRPHFIHCADSVNGLMVGVSMIPHFVKKFQGIRPNWA